MKGGFPMPVMDEFKEERAALKNASFKVKWNYFWDYYKMPVIISAIAIALVTTFVVQVIQRKDTALFVAMINSVEMQAEPSLYVESFCEYAEIDTEEATALFDTTMYIDFDNLNDVTKSSLEKMMVYIAAQEVDAVVTDSAMMEYYAYGPTFIDLREFLTAEEIIRYEPYLYYIDEAVIREKEAAQDAMDYEFTPTYPANPNDPSTMKEPVPVGIYLKDNAETFLDNYYFSKGEPVLGVIINTTRPEETKKFIEFRELVCCIVLKTLCNINFSSCEFEFHTKTLFLFKLYL